MKFESLIFDIDGTLWDSRALVAGSDEYTANYLLVQACRCDHGPIKNCHIDLTLDDQAQDLWGRKALLHPGDDVGRVVQGIGLAKCSDHHLADGRCIFGTGRSNQNAHK